VHPVVNRIISTHDSTTTVMTISRPPLSRIDIVSVVKTLYSNHTA
jgi:hypothetical protein